MISSAKIIHLYQQANLKVSSKDLRFQSSDSNSKQRIDIYDNKKNNSTLSKLDANTRQNSFRDILNAKLQWS